jgi:hypothetical protein
MSIKAVEDRPGIRDMLEQTLERTKPRAWRVAEEPTAADGVREAWIACETEVGGDADTCGCSTARRQRRPSPPG